MPSVERVACRASAPESEALEVTPPREAPGEPEGALEKGWAAAAAAGAAERTMEEWGSREEAAGLETRRLMASPAVQGLAVLPKFSLRGGRVAVAPAEYPLPEQVGVAVPLRQRSEALLRPPWQ